MEDVNKRRRIFVSLSKLGCGLQEYNELVRPRLKQREFILIVTFSVPSPSSLLKLPNISHIPSPMVINLAN